MLEKPVMESGGGGLVSTTMDYARFSQMLLGGGTLDGVRIIGRKTLELMASNHLAPASSRLSPDAARPRLWTRLRGPHRRRHCAVPRLAGQFFLERHGRTFFWIDPKEDLFAVFMMQGPGQPNIPARWCAMGSTRRWSDGTAIISAVGAPTTTVMPAKAGHPVRRNICWNRDAGVYWITRRSLSSGGHSADPLAGDDTEWRARSSR